MLFKIASWHTVKINFKIPTPLWGCCIRYTGTTQSSSNASRLKAVKLIVVMPIAARNNAVKHIPLSVVLLMPLAVYKQLEGTYRRKLQHQHLWGSYSRDIPLERALQKRFKAQTYENHGTLALLLVKSNYANVPGTEKSKFWDKFGTLSFVK